MFRFPDFRLADLVIGFIRGFSSSQISDIALRSAKSRLPYFSSGLPSACFCFRSSPKGRAAISRVIRNLPDRICRSACIFVEYPPAQIKTGGIIGQTLIVGKLKQHGGNRPGGTAINNQFPFRTTSSRRFGTKKALQTGLVYRAFTDSTV